MADLPLPGSTTPVSVLSSDRVVRVPDGATALDVAETLVRDDIGLVVLGESEVTGVVSERDIVRAAASARPLSDVPAAEIATTDLVWCDEEASVEDVGAEMMRRYVRHVLVESAGRLVGVVSARDLLGALVVVEAPDEA